MEGISSFEGLLKEEAITIIEDYLKKFSGKEKRWLQDYKLAILEILNDEVYSSILFLIRCKKKPLNIYQMHKKLKINYGVFWRKIQKLKELGLINISGDKGILNGRIKKYPIKNDYYSNILDMIFEILPVYHGTNFGKNLV